MASSNEHNGSVHRANGSGPPNPVGDTPTKPDWADGLKQLYDSVVDEPLPDSFRDLLDQLDESDDGTSAKDGGAS